MAAWRAAQAKAEGPQLVTRRKHNFFVVSEEEYRRLQHGTKAAVPERSLWDALRPPPEAWTDEPIFERARGKARPVEF